MQYSQEHLKTMVYAEFGGQTECIMGSWKIENVRRFASSTESVQRTWSLRKHDSQTKVSVCAVIGRFRSPAFVSFFAFAVCLFLLLFWLKAIKNATVNGRKREANTIELNRQE